LVLGQEGGQPDGCCRQERQIMDSRTRRFNAELASLIGIQHIEVQYSINRIARQAMGIISRRLRFSLVDENIKSPRHIAYNIEIGFSEFASFVEKRIESLASVYLRNMGRIFTSTLEKYSMLEAKRTINKTLFPGVPKNIILKIVANQRVADRLLKKMQKSGMNPSTMAAIVSLQTDMAKRQNLLEQYFRAMRNNAYTIARTSMSELIGKAGKIAYESLPKDLVGFQVHGILDERIRPAHRARNGTIYYKKPRYDNPGFDQMPNPPLEADGSMAYNCRCWLTPIMSLDAQKFFDFKGRIIPNAKIFNEWFSTSSKDRQIMAIGVRRYNAAMKRLRKGEKLEWASMLDPVTGMLLDEKQLLAETPQKRAARIKKAKKVIGGT